MNESASFGSWGRVFAPRHEVREVRDRSAGLPACADLVLPYGMGRSYGDSCLNDRHTLIRTRGLDRLMAFDAATGVFRCEAGALLSDLIDFALPRGWFLPVTPGTRFVTVGGAIANDVHGKNHHRAGSFGHHVRRLELLRSDGSRLECTPSANEAMFRATVGGLGLTGLITWAEIALKRVSGPWIAQRSARFRSLAEFFPLCEALERDHEYVVAWLDCARAAGAGTRGILFAGDHDPLPGPAPTRKSRRFPAEPPFSLVNRVTLRAFNALYYRLAGRGDDASAHVAYESFFYPLDRLLQWNRLYGPRGFFQYQCGVPEGGVGHAALESLLRCIAAAGEGSFLAVLKRFGGMAPAGMMSFPRPGYTLALDFPNRGASTLALLERLDDVLAEVGGRVYPAKDARMSSTAFRGFYPEWERFAAFIDPRFSSSFWRRVTGGDAMGLRAP